MERTRKAQRGGGLRRRLRRQRNRRPGLSPPRGAYRASDSGGHRWLRAHGGRGFGRGGIAGSGGQSPSGARLRQGHGEARQDRSDRRRDPGALRRGRTSRSKAPSQSRDPRFADHSGPPQAAARDARRREQPPVLGDQAGGQTHQGSSQVAREGLSRTERDLEAAIESSPALGENEALLRSVPGVGPVLARTLLWPECPSWARSRTSDSLPWWGSPP